MAKKKRAKPLQPLDAIKRLLILGLLKRGKGATSEEIGRTLGVDSSVIRRLAPIRKVKSLRSR